MLKNNLRLNTLFSNPDFFNDKDDLESLFTLLQRSLIDARLNLHYTEFYRFNAM